MYRYFLIWYFLGAATVFGCHNHQVHIALSDFYHTLSPVDPMLKITFHTNNEECAENHVLLYLDDGTTRKIVASSAYFRAQYGSSYYLYGSSDYETYVHYAEVFDIKFDTRYQYEIFVSDHGTYEGPFSFKVPNPNPTSRQRNFVLYGDFDNSDDSQQSMKYLKKLAKDQSRPIDLFFHIGDLAYDLEKKGGKRGDDFMDSIQDIAANIPYMTTMGNHEALNNFSNFNMRFQMPQYQFSQNHLYSINVDNVHFVSIDLELPVLQPEYLSNVVSWLEQDLKAANANRAVRPWIIVYGHRPIWCSDQTERDDCLANPTRFQAVEEVMYKYGVDIYFAGHVHVYERNLPVYKGKVMPFTNPMKSDTGRHYIQDPQAPMYIVEGIPGHKDYPSGKSLYPVKEFCAKLDRDYSVGMITVQNNTHLLWQMIHTLDGSVGDYVYLIKTKKSYIAKADDLVLNEEQRQTIATVALERAPEGGRQNLYLTFLAAAGLLTLAYFYSHKRLRTARNSYHDSEQGTHAL